jgi:cell wall-associated NlpC family hydrolase
MLRDSMKSLHRTVSVLATAGVAVLVAPLAGAGTARADPIDDQRAQVEYYADQLEQLEEDMFRLAEEYDIAVDELGDLEHDVAAAEEAVAAKQSEVAQLQEDLADVAVHSYMNAGSSGMSVFSEPSAFNEELQRSELTRVALSSGTADSDDLREAVNDLAEEQENLEAQRAAQEQKAEEVAAAREAAETQTEEYEQAKAEAEDKLGDLIREEQERRARESYERMQREAAEAQARAEAQAQAQAQEQAQAQQAQQQSQSAQPTSGSGSTSGNRSAPAAAPSAPAIPAASSRAGTAVSAAMTQTGVPWVFGKAEPGVAFDCSGLTSWAWAQAGVGLPHQSAQQYGSTTHVPSSAAQPGDLIFFYSPISHVGMYIGGGQMIHSPASGSTVHVRSVNWSNVVGVGRPG